MTEIKQFFQNRNILVTGGAGFIGCAIAKRLAPAARRYVVMDNLLPQVHAESKRPVELHQAAELRVADVTEASAWEQVLDSFKPDVIVHLAAETGTGQSLTEASRHAMVNVVGTTRMTDALIRHGIRPEHVLLTSSRAVYGEGAWKRDGNGEIVYPGQRGRAQLERKEWDFPGMSSVSSAAGATVPHPTSVYGATKYAQEQVLGAWAGANKTSLSVLRLQNVYGPGQSLTNSYTGIVALFSRLARDKKSIPLYEDGEVTRDFVYIDDVANAIVCALMNVPANQRVADVGSGAGTSIAQLAAQIARHYGAPAPHVCGLFRDGDVRHATCERSGELAALGWQPLTSLAQGVAALQEWIGEKAGPATPGTNG